MYGQTTESVFFWIVIGRVAGHVCAEHQTGHAFMLTPAILHRVPCQPHMDWLGAAQALQPVTTL